MKVWRTTVSWTVAVLLLLGPYIVAFRVLEWLAPSWFQFADVRSVMIASCAIALPVWGLSYKLLTNWRWLNKEDRPPSGP